MTYLVLVVAMALLHEDANCLLTVQVVTPTYFIHLMHNDCHVTYKILLITHILDTLAPPI